MDVLKRIEHKARLAAEFLPYEMQYIPGATEEQDMYRAYFTALDVSCYGREQEDALSGAIVSATAKLLLRSQDVDNILREVARDRSRKTNLP